MKKPFMAVLIAFVVTACVGASIFAIGGAALVNKNGAQVSNSPDQASGVLAATTSQQSDQVNQLQSLVSQYQQREQQLLGQLDQANAQLQQDQQTMQQVQTLLSALQQRGLIRLTNDGQIVITQ